MGLKLQLTPAESQKKGGHVDKWAPAPAPAGALQHYSWGNSTFWLSIWCRCGSLQIYLYLFVSYSDPSPPRWWSGECPRCGRRWPAWSRWRGGNTFYPEIVSASHSPATAQPQPSHSPAGPVSWQITEMSFQNVINVTAQKGSKVAHLGSNQMISKMLNIVNTFCVGFPSNIFSIFCWKKIKYANCIFSQNKIAVASGDAELIHEY